MGKSYLIDSNAIIDYFNGNLPETGRILLSTTVPIISIITYIELFSGVKEHTQESNQLERLIS